MTRAKAAWYDMAIGASVGRDAPSFSSAQADARCPVAKTEFVLRLS
jgi:hypothetical protein